MPFLLYKEISKCTWKLVKGVELGGKGGPLASLFREKWCPDRLVDGIFFWEADRREILRALGYDDCSYHLVVNLKPNINISLYEVIWVMGASFKGWTPFLFRLETLYVDHIPDGKGSMTKEEIVGFLQEIEVPCEDGTGEIVHENLYLQGGYEGGDWKWGPVGATNGTLLWPRVARRFAQEMLMATE